MKLILFVKILFFSILFGTSVHASEEANNFAEKRRSMVKYQLANRGISSLSVLEAMETVPRHKFVPFYLKSKAYADHPLPIGDGQTISQPYIVALMTESLNISENDRILEIGTGSGYQAAILSRITEHVYTIEIKKSLFKKSTEVLSELYPGKIKTKFGDGYYGWRDEAPFDCIMITAAVNHIPPPLLEQLKDGGKLILPLGNPFSYQSLVLVTKNDDDYKVKQITGVLFVPMTGHALEPKQK